VAKKKKKRKRNAYGFCVGKHEERARLEDPDVNGRIMLKLSFKGDRTGGRRLD
jgi:hypothetical protein